MTTTPVGMRCPECASQRTKVVRVRQMAHAPRLTYALIAMNVIAFVAEGSSVFTFSGGGFGKLVIKGGLLGSSEDPALAGQGVAHAQYYRIITSGFLHENLLHIAFNMWVLYYLGKLLEPAIGELRFGLIYAVALLCGSLGALLVSPHVLTVGASGAIFGLMGAAAVEMRARQIPIMQSGIGALILINLVISFSLANISWGGHVGGLIGGALAALALRAGEARRSPILGTVACVAIGVFAIGGSIATSHASLVEPAGALPSSLSGSEP